VLFGESTALTAHAHYAGADGAPGRELFRSCRDRALRYLAPADPQLDIPVAGMVLFGLGTWGLLRGAAPADDAVRLLVLAERFAYNRTIPTMAWSGSSRAPRSAPRAGSWAGGRLRRPPAARPARGRALIEQLTA
jgi:hypothetical protein